MTKYTRKEFIEKLAVYAIEDMKKTNVPASLTIAQGILESADGNSTLATRANNLFGMKGTGTAGSISLPTREYIGGIWVTVNAQFRKYHNWGESVADHSNLFLNGVSWNRDLYRGLIGKDGITAAREVAKAGYATDPKYSDKLITLINENNLMEYDIIEEISQEKQIEELERKVSNLEKRLQEIPAPEWFVNEFPNSLDMLHQKTGTIDFWRAYAVTLRLFDKYFKTILK
jgi:flagellum-specific peptidoglycan hydrolase FlgJ